MEYNESNFVYLKKTSMEKYYDELVKAEYVCEYFPMVTKIIVRKVIEALLKDIALKYNMESNIAAWNLLNYIKVSASFSLSEEIYDSIEIILVNGYEHAPHNNINKKISKQPIEILEIIHNILCWYLKKIEPQTVIVLKDLSFKAPSTIEYKQNEVKKIKKDIVLKENQINNLRQKIIELSSQSKNISELTKIIIAIKEEKVHLEDIQTLLTKKIQLQKNQVEDTEKNYKMYIKKLDKLKEKCTENQELLFNKESQLVKAELKNQELKTLNKELDEKDESIIRMEQYLEEELKIVRQSHEHLLNLTIQYQDILETIEFSYDKELQKILEIQKNNIKMEINFEDRMFNDNMDIYTKSIVEVKRKVIIFKEILNEQIKRDIKYEPFYRGFLNLGGKELRIIYTIVIHVNATSNLISKSKELLLKPGEDKFIELINKNLKELKNINDDEIKLIIYYKLIKLAQISFGHIYNRKQFIKALDNMVDRAYDILMPKKDFNGKIKKLDAIISYYLEKLIIGLKSKSSNLQLSQELVDKIYKTIITLKQNEENIGKEHIYYDKFNLDNMPEAVLRTSIKSQPFIFLSIMVELGGIASYKEVSNIVFEVENLIAKRSLLKRNGEEVLATNFSNEYFMVLLFLSSGYTSLNQNQQEDVLPLLIMQIMSIDLISESDAGNLKNYNGMINSWKHKQQKYNDIFIEKEDRERELDIFIKEKQEIEINSEKLLKDYATLFEEYNNYHEEFKRIIMNSEKRVLLPSYLTYDELRSKKELAESHINESKNKHGALKSIVSPELWKDHASKLINEANMLDAEKSLIEEAKQKPYFKKEYSVFLELEKNMDEINKLINKEKENLKNKNSLIDTVKVKINELQKQLNTIKDVYLDI